jgi:hypothetical protein
MILMDQKLVSIIYRNSQIFKNNNISVKNFFSSNYLLGGGKKNLQVTYHNHVYEYEYTMNDNYYVLFSKNKLQNECVVVVIDKEKQMAELHSIGNYDSCLANTNENVGSTLLKITIKLLKKYKDKFGIKWLVLTDNSIKKCGSTQIILPVMKILLTGHTWYGRYGFRPIKYKNNYYFEDEQLMDFYNSNMNIISKIKINDIDIIKYITLTENEKVINTTRKILLEHPDLLLKDFLIGLLKNFDKNCIYFSKFYLQLFKDLHLFGLFKTFGLEL